MIAIIDYQIYAEWQQSRYRRNLPRAWGYDAKDYTCIKDIYRKLGRGRVSLAKYPHMNTLQYFKYAYLGEPIRVNLLNYIPYSKKRQLKS